MKAPGAPIAFLFLALAASLPARASGFEIGEVRDGTLFFKATEGLEAPPPLRTRLRDIEPLGLLHPAEAALPFVLLSGRPCASEPCHEPRTIFMIRADGSEHHEFTLPGKITDPKSRRLLYSSRAYFGKCLPGWGDVYVTFQQEAVDRRRYLQHSVFVAEAGKDGIREKLIARRRPQLRTTQQRVKQKMCHPIKGTDRMMPRRPLHHVKFKPAPRRRAKRTSGRTSS